MISPSSSRPETGVSPPFPGDRRILFGHQSVGTDLLQGVHSVSAAASISDLEDNGPDEGVYGLFHFRIGRNGDPYSKIDDFADRILSREVRWDVAAMKLCYVDIDRHSDVERVFEHYVEMIESLSRSIPDLRIFHITVPLRTIRLGLRSRLRLIAGRDVDILEDNLQRDRYNSLLRDAFPSKTQVFDLALIESTRPDNTPLSWTYKREQIPGLYSGFTSDGGHLNNAGASVVAGKFVAFMNELRT